MSQSLARLHYPYLVYRDRQKMLWDPVRSQPLKIQPEERVRQRLLNCFIHESIFSKSRITTEAATQLSGEDTIRRTDIVCYDKDFEPALLVECKAEYVPLTEKAATQIANYNRNIEAPLLLLSNGYTDHWYELNTQKAQALETPPSPYSLSPDTIAPKDTDYWIKRGFIGKNSPVDLQHDLADILEQYWIGKEHTSRSVSFLSFNQHPDHLVLDHYYFVDQVQVEPRINIALAFSASMEGHSNLACIINRKKENIGFIDINLNLLFDGNKPNMYGYTAEHISEYDAAEQLNLEESRITRNIFADLPAKIAEWFFTNELPN